MRTQEERLEQIHKRTKEIQKKERRRRRYIWDAGCIAACVLLVFCLGMIMPQVTGQLQYTQMGTLSSGAASIFGNNGAQGYILMGILCFLLGVCVTILMYRLHHKTKENDPDEL